MSHPGHTKKVKFISVKEARDRLPKVKEILKQIEPIFMEFLVSQKTLVDNKEENPHEISKLRYKVDQAKLQVDDLTEELLDLDCVLKDLKTGLVDFVAVKDDNPVWLCFKRGEEDLKYYHDWNAGFVGRQLIDFN